MAIWHEMSQNREALQIDQSIQYEIRNAPSHELSLFENSL
jgi:hypothetical protein